MYFIWVAHWYVINATHYQEHRFTYWKRVYTRIFTATLHLLKGIYAQLCWIFCAKLIPKLPKSWSSMFSVPCLKYCRSLQELWDSVHCINHKYIGMFLYWSGVSKSREYFSIMHTCTYSTAQAKLPPPPPSYMYYRNIPIFFSFSSLSMSRPGLESLFKNSTRYMYPIRASQSACFVASDYPIRGIYGVTKKFPGFTFGVVRTINLRWLILMIFNVFSTNNFHAVKKFKLSAAEPEKKFSRDDVIAARHAKIPHVFISQ